MKSENNGATAVKPTTWATSISEGINEVLLEASQVDKRDFSLVQSMLERIDAEVWAMHEYLRDVNEADADEKNAEIEENAADHQEAQAALLERL